MNKLISKIAICYFLLGILFAFFYAWYYHWSPFSYFSPNFWFVIISWPFQLGGGFASDILNYGLAGKPI